MDGFTAVAAAAATVTGVVAIIRRVVDTKTPSVIPAVTWPIAAIAVGVGASVGWHVNFAPVLVANVPALVHASSSLAGTSGEIISGLIAGLVAGFLHDAFALIRSATAPVKTPSP